MEQVNVLMQELTDMVGSLSAYEEFEQAYQSFCYQYMASIKQLILEESTKQ
jgi:hypothetical protein